jgi:hypothetical protein
VIIFSDDCHKYLMDINQLFESEASDSIARQEALDAFKSIKIWLKLNEGYLEPDLLIQSATFPDGYFFPIRRAGVPENGLYILLLPKAEGKNGYAARASFGTTKHGAVIALHVLLGPSDLKFVDTRLGGFRTEFVHEYMHYLSWKHNRLGRRGGSSRAVDAGNMSAYYNNEDETNAYFQEAADSILSVIGGLVRAGEPAREILTGLAARSMTELTQYMKQKFFDKDFLDHATEKTMRALNKRLARLLSETVLPMIHEAIAQLA